MSKGPVFLRDLTRPCSLLRFCIHSNAVIKYSKNKSNIKDLYLSFAHDCNSFVNGFEYPIKLVKHGAHQIDIMLYSQNREHERKYKEEGRSDNCAKSKMRERERLNSQSERT